MGKRAPAGLGDAGRRLWQEVARVYELEPAELAALDQACRTLDELRDLEEALAAAPPVVAGSKGQPRPHPLYAELRYHRATLARLLRSVSWPSAAEQTSDRIAAANAAGNARQAGALARWRDHRESHGS